MKMKMSVECILNLGEATGFYHRLFGPRFPHWPPQRGLGYLSQRRVRVFVPQLLGSSHPQNCLR
jgi:hypothetical protein